MRPVLFDCDGVLVDSEALSCEATADLLKARGFDLDGAEVMRRFLGRSIAAVYAHCAALGRPLDPGFADEKERLYVERARGVLQPIPGAHAVVERLAGRAPIAVATSGSPGKVAFSLRETGLARHFDVVVCAVEVARGKPAPDLFLLAAERLGVDPRTCLVVEDAAPGIAAARAAGMVAVGLASSISREALRAAGADVVVDRLDQLLDLPELG
ncbi:MAG: HAD family hydrolase [Polyangiales bacterium]